MGSFTNSNAGSSGKASCLTGRPSDRRTAQLELQERLKVSGSVLMLTNSCSSIQTGKMPPMNGHKASLPGRRLLHTTIDDYASDVPDRVWASIPQSGNLCDGYRDISYATFANAINRLSWWLESSIGPAKPGIPTICYIGPADIRYCLIALASAKTHYKVSSSGGLRDKALQTFPALTYTLRYCSART